MKKTALISILLTISGCTSDHYLPADAGMKDALHECVHKNMTEAAATHDHLGALLGGAAGGVIGGAVGGAIEGSQNTAPKKDWNIEIENCMKAKGYTGTSEHYN